MLRPFPSRARALGRRARRRRGDRGRRGVATSPRSTGEPPGSAPRVDAVVAAHDLPLGHHAHACRPRRAHRVIARSCPPPSRRSAALSSAGWSPCRWCAAPSSSPATSPRVAAPASTASCPRGMRAMRIVVTDALRPRPGAAVDVLASFDPGGAGERDDGTVVVAAGVTVVGTRPAERRAVPDGPAPRASRCWSTRTRRRRSPTRRPTAWSRSRSCHPRTTPRTVVASGAAVLPVLHAIILGIVQGLSEFLPISSSGHLILVPELFGWTELTDERLARTRRSTSRCTSARLIAVAARTSGARCRSYVVAALALDRARARSHGRRSGSPGCSSLTAIPGALVGAALSRASSRTTSATRSSSAST